MLKNIKNKKLLIASVLSLGIVVAATGVGKASFTDPGSSNDPLVTRSYVEQRIEQIRFYIDEKIKGAMDATEINKNKITKLEEENAQLRKDMQSQGQVGSGSATGTTFQVVQLRKGQKLIGKAGTEIIFRTGQAKAIVPTTASGGLSDVTGARDIQGNEPIPSNHLIIIPRADGRAILAEESSFFMVKGNYDIE